KVDFKNLFLKLKDKYSIKRMTIQSGGTLNSKLIRDGLINRVSIVIAPCLIGGKKTSTIMDGDSLKDKTELKHIKSLKLLKVNKLKNSYLQLTYKINN
ncbi:deaminase, partial [archaeon]|nr:deaminase [archaeon]